MTTLFNKFNQELINKGLVFDYDGQYEESQHLEAIYPWGYILVFDCNVLSPLYKLYDNQNQFICCLDYDDDKWNIINGHLKCERTYFVDGVHKFSYDLNQGAPIHVSNVKALLMKNTEGLSTDDDRIIIVEIDNRLKAFWKKDCEPLKDITDSALPITEYLMQGYELLSEDCYASNVDMFNDLIVVNRK